MEIKVDQIQQTQQIQQTRENHPTDGSFKFTLASHVEEAELQTRLDLWKRLQCRETGCISAGMCVT